MTKRSTFEIDRKPVQILAPPDRFHRYEGISFSSSGSLLAIAAVGANVTFTLQLCPAASVVPQLFVAANGADAAMLVMLRGMVSLLVTVTTDAALVEFTG